MEKLSALMDGELEDRELADEIARINGDPDREADWGIYHMIGDSLRGDAVSQDTVTGPVAARLAAEPTVLAPRAWRMRPETRRVALPIAASLCGVAVVAWLALSNNALFSPAEQNAQLAAETRSSERIVQVADTESDSMSDYMIVHQPFHVRTVSSADAAR